MATISHTPPSGRHILAELSGCTAGKLNDADWLEAVFRDCAARGGAKVISSHFYRFSPQGISGVVIIAESHVTVHTWPEHGYAAIDVFTCGRPEVADAVMKLITAELGAAEIFTTSFDRGPDRIPLRSPEMCA